MTWISENGTVLWYEITDKCDTPNKAKILAMSEELEDSEYIDLRVRKVYGKLITHEEFGDNYLILCDKDDEGAFQVWEVRDVVLQEKLNKYKLKEGE